MECIKNIWNYLVRAVEHHVICIFVRMRDKGMGARHEDRGHISFEFTQVLVQLYRQLKESGLGEEAVIQRTGGEQGGTHSDVFHTLLDKQPSSHEYSCLPPAIDGQQQLLHETYYQDQYTSNRYIGLYTKMTRKPLVAIVYRPLCRVWSTSP